MRPVLRLCEDALSNDGAMELAALPRTIFVVHGSVAVGDRILRDEETFSGEGAVLLKAGSAGAMLWRWEFITREADFGGPPAGQGMISHEKLAAALATVPDGALLLRGDSVAFPPGGCAYLHRHPHRYPRPLHLIRSRRRVVRNRPGRRVRASRGAPDALCPRHDLAARLSRQKFGRISQRSRQGQAEVAEP
jgi:hypothetical protein